MKKVKNLVLIGALCIFIHMGCDPVSKCPDFEDWGDFELIETSKELLAGVDTSKKVVFVDSSGKEIHYTIFRDDRFFLSYYNCDQNENGIIDSEEPLVFRSNLEGIIISYFSSDFTDINLFLTVNIPEFEDPLTKENFENEICDILTIKIASEPTFSWIVDTRKSGAPLPEYLVHVAEEITLNEKLFTHVYWDDKYLINGKSNFVIYFNEEFGIVGIRNTLNGYLLSFDHFE